MNVEKRIDKNNPKYDEYIAHCKSLTDAFVKKEEQILAKYPRWEGLDHPADVEINPIRRQFHADLKKLQRRYSFLFVEGN